MLRIGQTVTILTPNLHRVSVTITRICATFYFGKSATGSTFLFGLSQVVA